MKQLFHYVKRWMHESGDAPADSVAITDRAVIDRYVSDPDFPFLVSFPRTGSHWLRMLMELYFERPSLFRVFYYPVRRDYLTLHTHDLELDVHRRNVLYLYRNPVPTVYSLMRYHGEALVDADRVTHWSSLYGRHLKKWLLDEKSARKTVIRYEYLEANPFAEFGKVAAHFGQALDERKLEEALGHVTKESIREKTRHDKQVINTDSDYEDERQSFFEKQGKLIESNIYGVYDELTAYCAAIK